MSYAENLAIRHIRGLEEPKNIKITPGQPKKFKFKELQDRIVGYFEHCSDEANEENPKITGLAMVCGFYGRQQMHEYEAYPEFSDLIKKARTFVESSYEGFLTKGQAAGPIFALKQQGWTDTLEQTVKTEVEDPETLKKEIVDLIKSEGLT